MKPPPPPRAAIFLDEGERASSIPSHTEVVSLVTQCLNDTNTGRSERGNEAGQGCDDTCEYQHR